MILDNENNNQTISDGYLFDKEIRMLVGSFVKHGLDENKYFELSKKMTKISDEYEKRETNIKNENRELKKQIKEKDEKIIDIKKSYEHEIKNMSIEFKEMQREIEYLKNKDKKEVSIKINKKSRRKNKQVKKQKEIFLVYKCHKSKINDLAREIKKRDFDLDFLKING